MAKEALSVQKLIAQLRLYNLIARLRFPTEGRRRSIARALGEIGPAASAAVPALVDGLLTTSDERLSWTITDALHEIGASAVPVLIDALLAASNDRARSTLIDALRAMPRRMAEALYDTYARRGEEVRTALTKDGAAAVQALVGVLRGAGSEKSRRDAADVLGALGAAASPAVPALIDALLTTSDDGLSWRVEGALRAIGTLAVPALIDALRAARDDEARLKLVDALRAMRIHATYVPAIEPFHEALKVACDDRLRRAVAEALGWSGPDSAPAKATLLAALASSQDYGTRRTISWALGRIGAAAVPDLIKALEAAKDDRTRVLIAWSLRDIGPEAGAAIPALVRASSAAHDQQTASFIAQALGQIDPGAVPASSQTLEDTRQQSHDASALTREGPLPLLTDITIDPEPDVDKDEFDNMVVITRDGLAATFSSRRGRWEPGLLFSDMNEFTQVTDQHERERILIAAADALRKFKTDAPRR